MERTRPIRSPVPAEQHPPVAAPTRKKLVMMPIHKVPLGTDKLVEGGFLHERKKAHLQAVEEPAKQGRGQGHPFAEIGGAGFGRVMGSISMRLVEFVEFPP